MSLPVLQTKASALTLTYIYATLRCISLYTMRDFASDTTQLVSLFLESVFFGFHLISFALCLAKLLRADHNRPKYSLLITALVLFVFVVLDVVFGLWKNLQVPAGNPMLLSSSVAPQTG